jgi:uncharacterized protein (TIGR00369 family)
VNLQIDRRCFVCGPDNERGLKLRFEHADGKATVQCTIDPEYQGYSGVSHGGILAAILDETMVYAAVSLGKWVATAEMTVRYSKPVPVGELITVRAEVTRHQRRLVECSAEVTDEHGVVLASATGKLVQGRAVVAGERDR